MDSSIPTQHNCGYYIIIIIVVRPSISVALANRLMSIKLFGRAGNLFCRLMPTEIYFLEVVVRLCIVLFQCNNWE